MSKKYQIYINDIRNAIISIEKFVEGLTFINSKTMIKRLVLSFENLKL